MKPSKMAKSNRPAVAESKRSAVTESKRSAVAESIRSAVAESVRSAAAESHASAVAESEALVGAPNPQRSSFSQPTVGLPLSPIPRGDGDTREMLARARAQKRAEESTEGRERVAMGIMEYQSEMAWQFAERKAKWHRMPRERDARAGA